MKLILALSVAASAMLLPHMASSRPKPADAPSKHAALIAPFTTKSKSVPIRHPIEGVNSQVIRLSPDGRFQAALTIGDALPGGLTVSRVGRTPGKRVSREFVDATSAVWVPRHKHCLTFATQSDDYGGTEALVLWTGPGHVKYLKHVRGGHSDGGYRVIGVSEDGRTLSYQRFVHNSSRALPVQTVALPRD